MSGHSSVSIALLTRDGAATLPELLDAIWRQRTSRKIEIIAVDSGSTDATLETLNGRVTKVVSIDPGAFNHGSTRNLAVEHATNELVIFVVQDAVPVDEHWLEALVAPFEDLRVAGAVARQVPQTNASALTRHYLSLWVAAGHEPWTSQIDSEAEWRALAPVDRFRRCVFDNVCSCIRRSVWKNTPFSPTPIAEDMEWARDVLLAGHRIVYVPEAAVRHSHDRPALYEFRRTYILHRRLFDLFGLRTIPTYPLLARAVTSSLALHLWSERASPARWARAAALAAAWPAGQYYGARAAIRRSPLPRWRPGTV